MRSGDLIGRMGSPPYGKEHSVQLEVQLTDYPFLPPWGWIVAASPQALRLELHHILVLCSRSQVLGRRSL